MASTTTARNEPLVSPLTRGIVLVAGVVLAGTLYFFSRSPVAAFMVVAGAAGVALLLLAYEAVVRWRQRRRSVPLRQALLSNAAASPHAVSEPARRAALDDLRRKFEAGLARFSAAGKDLYSLPWYMLVGEPGGGKTEAIRHCNVGFPPGLQDYTQGAGGTLNMNWWFTNYAIIIDTARRMMFEEVPAGTTSEWSEFLQMLVRARPNCPVNGLLLAIPADSLIKDNADEIQRKGSRIAQQLDSIQRALGVRFPVYVVVTKCDLINGFREFFENLTDPQLQHQIMGWSNPEPLDKPFDAEQVDRHLREVRQRLLRRCQVLLLDPGDSPDVSARRIDQVDTLYAFPDSFVKIASRLKLYLQMVFVAGEWSPQPLFLRGIYFTSSMRENAALDADLAEVLKVPVETLKGDGRAWEKERAYFLRDLFVGKVFREKGLVTRAANTRKLQRKRQLVTVGTLAVAAAALLLLTWLGLRRLTPGFVKATEYWARVSFSYATHPSDWRLVKADRENDPSSVAFQYNGSAPVLDDPVSLVQFFSSGSEASGGGTELLNLDGDRKAAYRRLFESSVLAPTVDAARAKLLRLADQERQQERAAQHASASASASASATPVAAAAKLPPPPPDVSSEGRLQAAAALTELVRLEAQGAGATKDSAAGTGVDLDKLMRFVLPSNEYEKFKRDQPALQEEVDRLAAGGAWPPAVLAVRPADPNNLSARELTARQSVDAGVTLLKDYCLWQAQGQLPPLSYVRSTVQALAEFDKFNARLAELCAAGGGGGAGGSQATAVLTSLLKARKDADAALADLDRYLKSGKVPNPAPEGIMSLSLLYEKLARPEANAARKACDEVDAADAAATPHLDSVREQVKAAKAVIPGRENLVSEELEEKLFRADDYLAVTPPATPHRYEVYGNVYELVLAALKRAGNGGAVDLAAVEADIDKRLAAAGDTTDTKRVRNTARALVTRAAGATR